MMTNAFKITGLILFIILLLMILGCGEARAAADAAKKPPGGADVNAMLVWLSTISILGIGASVAAAVFLPVKRLAVASIAGFGSILALALFVKAALPFLPWALAGIAVVAVAAAIVLFRRYVLATHAAVGFGVAMEQAETDESAKLVKDTHAKIQDAAGIKGIIDASLAKMRGKQ